MKQVLLQNGEIVVEEIPLPSVEAGQVLVRTAFSLISSGTELAGKKSSGQSLFKKVLSNPQNIKKGLKFLRKRGLGETLEAATKSLKRTTALGYSLSGRVVKVGSSVKEFQAGDRVACAGTGYASHAQFVAVPKNLVVKIPEAVELQDASSVTLGSIAMQGLRRADVKLGENIAVVGLGLLGQILIQLLKANGVRVIGFDIEDEKANLAKELGADVAYNSRKFNILEKVSNFTQEKGVDAAIITASAPENNQIIQESMEITRKKGRVVVVGDVGLGPKRSPFYEKEIDYLISTSYGPGRYDRDYEEKGVDYPFSYVRWTEKRNMEEYLRLLAEGKINFQKLIFKVFPIEEAPEAYRFLGNHHPAKPAVLLDYHFTKESASSAFGRRSRLRSLTLHSFSDGAPTKSAGKEEVKLQIKSTPLKKDIINVGLIGAGGFAKGMHLPNLKKLSNQYLIYTIVDSDGINASQAAKKFGSNYCATDYRQILDDKNVDLVFITTPHRLHAKIAEEAAKAKKAIFCEKPMALNERELDELTNTLNKTKAPYLVGFNRRFSPFAKKIKEILKEKEGPIIIDYQMNAGFVPRQHWVQTEIGGGRNIGEACHIYDLFTYFTESKIEKINAHCLTPKREKYLKNDNFIASLKFKDGSICNLTYTAKGWKEFPKEQMKIYFDGKMIVLNDYKEMRVYGIKEKRMKLKKQDKGHLAEIEEFAYTIKNGGQSPIPLWQLIQATKISFEVEKQLK